MYHWNNRYEKWNYDSFTSNLCNKGDEEEGRVWVDELKDEQLRNERVVVLSVRPVILSVRQTDRLRLIDDVEYRDLNCVQNGSDCAGKWTAWKNQKRIINNIKKNYIVSKTA